MSVRDVRGGFFVGVFELRRVRIVFFDDDGELNIYGKLCCVGGKGEIGVDVCDDVGGVLWIFGEFRYRVVVVVRRR